MPQVNACVLPAVSAEDDSFTVKRDFNSGAIVKPIITTYMHIVSTAVLVTIFLDVETQVLAHGDGSDGSVFVANHF